MFDVIFIMKSQHKVAIKFDLSFDKLEGALEKFFKQGYAILPKKPRKGESQNRYAINMNQVEAIKIVPLSE